MPKQPAFPGLRHAMKKKRTRREKFLAEMEAVVPWIRLLVLIEPHYPKAGPKGGRPPMPLETMLRIYFLQNWYALSDPMAEEMLYDSDAMRHFAGIELGDDRIPDETTILNFRHLLEAHQLTETLFTEVNCHLADQGITLRSGTLVDATIIDAPSSTKNEARARDPEMSSTKKGNDWYFGMKAHVGVDAESGIVHSLETTTAKVHDSQVWDALLHGQEDSVWADKGYVSAAREAAFAGPDKLWGVMRKAPKGSALDPVDADINRIIAMVRARVEHPFATKPAMACEMVSRILDEGTPCAFVLADAVYGSDFRFRRMLEARGQPYVLAVRSTHSLRFLEEWHLVQTDPATMIADLPPAAWHALSAGEGAKGHRLYDWARVPLNHTSGEGFSRWLLARRSLRDPEAIAYYFAYACTDTTLPDLAAAAGLRWTIEECFLRAKDDLGLDHCEARSWHGWHRHMSLVMAAAAFLARLSADQRRTAFGKPNKTSPQPHPEVA